MFTFKSLKSFLLVLVQFICIGLLFFVGDPFEFNALFIFQVFGFIYGIWGIIIMNFSVNIFPDVNSNHDRLIKKGPYKFIRHPMYFAVLSVTYAWVSNNLNILGIVIWLILLGDIILKMNYEEKLLENKYLGYREYKKETWRLIPYIY